MMIKRYRERKFIEAVKFENNFESIQEIMTFAGITVNAEFSPTGIQLRIVKSPFNVAIVQQGEYVVKTEDGTLSVMTEADITTNYDETND